MLRAPLPDWELRALARGAVAAHASEVVLREVRIAPGFQARGRDLEHAPDAALHIEDLCAREGGLAADSAVRDRLREEEVGDLLRGQ
eukprot:14861250-Heterocapsa_arctica.AAC.1